MTWLAFALGAAVCFGLRGILYQWTSQKPINRNLLLLGVYLSGTIVALGLNLFYGQKWSLGTLAGIGMGVFSFTSNAAMYKGFSVGKASLVAIFTALPPVVVIAIAYFAWGETLSLAQGLAFIIILIGILSIKYSSDISLSNLQGIQWALLAMLGFGLTDIFSKQSTLWHADLLPTLAVMYGTGSLLFWISWRMNVRKESQIMLASAGEVAATSEGVRAWGTMRTLLWGLFVGLSNISGMLLILPAFRLGVTGLVSAVIAMNVLLILLYARVVLKEKFRKLEIAGMVLAIVGMLVLRLAG